MVLEVIPVWNVYLSSSHGCRALNIWSWPQLRTQKIPWTFILFFNLGILICGQVLIHVSWKNQRTAEHESRLTTTAPTWHPAAELIKGCTLKNVSMGLFTPKYISTRCRSNVVSQISWTRSKAHHQFCNCLASCCSAAWVDQRMYLGKCEQKHALELK